MPPPCEICGAEGTFKCSQCGQAFYCCLNHQREGWRKGHKLACPGRAGGGSDGGPAEPAGPSAEPEPISPPARRRPGAFSAKAASVISPTRQETAPTSPPRPDYRLGTDVPPPRLAPSSPSDDRAAAGPAPRARSPGWAREPEAPEDVAARRLVIPANSAAKRLIEERLFAESAPLPSWEELQAEQEDPEVIDVEDAGPLGDPDAAWLRAEDAHRRAARARAQGGAVVDDYMDALRRFEQREDAAAPAAGVSPLLRSGICRYVNLDRREDRRRQMEGLASPHRWLSAVMRRVPAVVGSDLSWEQLVRDGLITPEAHIDALRAEQMRRATIDVHNPQACSSHLTLGGCGCALSHRKAWQELADSDARWALIMEDDLVAIHDSFDAELVAILGRLPVGWHLCYLGFHLPPGSSAPLLPDGVRGNQPLWHMTDRQSWLAGLYCYLLSRAGARLLLEEAVPFESQVDTVAGSLAVASGRCYAVRPGQFLAYSPPTEESMDTDVQTFDEDMI